MRTGEIEKLKRLITFRERQRDMAAAEMETAKQREAAAKEERQQAEDALTDELAFLREHIGHSLHPEEMELAVLGAKWAQLNLSQKEVALKQQEEQTDAERRNLLESHKKVKQMETLHQTRLEDRNRRQARIQQAELDDLAVVKEVHK